MKRLIAIALLFLPLAGCGDGEFSRMIPLGGGGGGGSYSAPAPAATPIPRSVGQPGQTDIPGTAGVMAIQREQYGAVNAAGCDVIARRMAKRGFRLVAVIPNNLGVGGVLDVICVFESDSADPGDGRIYTPQY